MAKAHYVRPSQRPLWVNAVAVIIYGAVAWTIVSHVEKWRNPANLDLETVQKIHEMEQLVYRKYDEPDAAQ